MQLLKSDTFSNRKFNRTQKDVVSFCFKWASLHIYNHARMHVLIIVSRFGILEVLSRSVELVSHRYCPFSVFKFKHLRTQLQNFLWNFQKAIEFLKMCYKWVITFYEQPVLQLSGITFTSAVNHRVSEWVLLNINVAAIVHVISGKAKKWTTPTL